MFHRSRALLALALAAALTAGGFAAASAAHSSHDQTQAESSGDAGFLGVNLQDLTPGLRESYGYDETNGVVVTSVISGSPADKAGIEEGDIITRFNHLAVNNADQLTTRVRGLSPGTVVSVSVWRDGKNVDLGEVALGSMADAGGSRAPHSYRYAPRAPRAPRPPQPPSTVRPMPPGAPEPPDAPEAPEGMDDHWEHVGPRVQALLSLGRGRLGVETQDLDSDLGSYFSTPDGKGVLVLRVVDDTPAQRAGLKAGDVILSVDGDAVADGDDLRGVLREKPAGDVDLRIRRKGAERTIHATLEKPAPEGNWMRLGRGNGWMGWLDDGDGMGMDGPHGPSRDQVEKHMYRYRVQGDGGPGEVRIDGMDDGERDQLRKEMDELRRDLEQMRRDLKNSR
jgi:membrane-associated protease RseP (regulator of RpoE activity)